jgi:hypothetical protein
MCSHHSAPDIPKYEAPKPIKTAPTPTPVQSADVEADKGMAQTERKKKTGTRANTQSTDRGTILGSVYDRAESNKLG